MGSAVPIQSTQNKLSQWAARYWGIIDVVIATIVGVVVLPRVFESMRTRDIQLGERVSLVFVLWFVLAVIASVVILRARSEVVRDVDAATVRLLALVPAGGQHRPASSTAGDASPESLQLRGMIVVHAMIDLILLFILQATVRRPFVGLIGPQVSPGIVDGAFVVVVVLVAIFVLIRLRGASRPLIERLAFAGLDQVVPTAGFSSGSASATFAARLSTTTSRSAASTSSRAASRPASPSSSGPSSDVTRPTGDEGAVVTSADGLAPTEATVMAPELDKSAETSTEMAPPVVSAADSTVLAPGADSARDARRIPSDLDHTVVEGASDQTIVAPSPTTSHGKDRTS